MPLVRMFTNGQMLTDGRLRVCIAFLLLGAGSIVCADETVRAAIVESSAAPLELTEIDAVYTASYKKGVPIKGTARRTLKRNDDGSWLYRFDVNSWIVDISETTVLRWEDNRVKPQSYLYERSGWATGRKRSYVFDYAAGKVDVNRDGKKLQAELTDGMLDSLGYQLQLRMDLAMGKTSMQYDVAHRGGSREMKFEVVGEEDIKSGNLSIPSVVVERVRDDEDGRETKLWFGKNIYFALVQMTQVEPDGEAYEVLLEEATIDGSKLKLDL